MMGEAYDLYVRIDFGEYKGMTINEIIQKKPDRLIWYLDNVDGFMLTDAAMAELDNATM